MNPAAANATFPTADAKGLQRQIAEALASMNGKDTGQLCHILHSLLTCMQDLDGRVQALEAALAAPALSKSKGAPVSAPAPGSPGWPGGVRSWPLTSPNGDGEKVPLEAGLPCL